MSSKKAELYLLLATAIWGLTFPIVGAAMQKMNPVDFVFLRFTLATLLMLPFIFKHLKQTDSTTLIGGLLLGMINLGTYSFQCIGLKTLSPAESAFITSISVALVPVLLLLFNTDKPSVVDFACSFICVIGLYILTGANISSLNFGEWMTFLCAACAAISIVIIQVATNKTQQFNLLVFYQILFTALAAMPCSMLSKSKIILGHEVLIALLFCSFFATIVTLYLQAKFQKYTTAPKAALIFCTEPLFASFYAWSLYSENITVNTLMGGAIILFSIAAPDLLKLGYFKNLSSRT